MDTSVENSIVESSQDGSSLRNDENAAKHKFFRRLKARKAKVDSESLITTEFDDWVIKTVAKATATHIKRKSFFADKLNIEIKVRGSHEGTFSILIDKSINDKEKWLAVQPYDYKGHDVFIEGDADAIMRLLKKHTSLEEELEKKTVTVTIKNNDDPKLIQKLKWHFTVSEEYQFIKDNQYLNLKLMLAVFSLGCATCGIFTYLITTDKESAVMMNTLCVLAAFAIFPLAIINRNAFDHFTRILTNVGFTLVGVLLSLNLFRLLYDKYSNNDERLRIYIPMIICLFVFSIILCYYVVAAAFFLWTIVSKLCTKLFGFTKSEDGEGYDFKVRNSVLLKIIAVISTILALIAYVTPILSPVMEMLKDKS